MSSKPPPLHGPGPRLTPSSRLLALSAACLSAWLCSLKRIAVVGDDGHVNPQAVDGGSGGVRPPFVITPLQAVNQEAAWM